MTEYKNLTRKRLLGYWLKNGELQVLMIFGIYIFYSVWQYVAVGGVTLEQMNYVTKMLGAMLIAVWQLSNRSTFSMALVFGSTRRETFAGHQIALCLEAVQLIIVNTAIDGAILRMEGTAVSLELYGYKVLLNIAILLLAIGIGQMGAIVVSRFGNRGMALVGGLCGMFFVGVAGLSVALREELSAIFPDWNQIVWILLAAGVVVYFAGMLAEKRYLVKMEVTI